jgi:hypothetical protein
MSLKHLVTVPALVLVVGIQAVSPASAHSVMRPAQAAHLSVGALAPCTTTGYSKNCGGCVTVSSSGKYTVKVPHTTTTIVGTHGKAGATVCFTKVAVPVSSKGGLGLRVTSKGTMGSVKVKGKHVTIYRYTAASNKLTKVKTIKKPGIYQVVTQKALSIISR